MLAADLQLHTRTQRPSTLVWTLAGLLAAEGDICSKTQGHPLAGSAKHPGKAEPKRCSCPLQGASGGSWLGALPAAHIRQGQMDEVTDKGQPGEETGAIGPKGTAPVERGSLSPDPAELDLDPVTPAGRTLPT